MINSDQAINVKTSAVIIIIELLKRLTQTFLGVHIFDYPPLLLIRNFGYRLLLKAPSGLSIGHNCYFLRADAVFNLRGDEKLDIGRDVAVNHNCEIDYSGGLVIGHRVWISQNTLIETHEHKISQGPKDKWAIERTQLIIEDDVWIGANVTILSHVRKIGRGAIVAAGAVVTKEVEPFSVVGGVPARHLKYITP